MSTNPFLKIKEDIEFSAFMAVNEAASKFYKKEERVDPKRVSKCVFVPESELSAKYVYYIQSPNGLIERRYDLSSLNRDQRRELFEDIKKRSLAWKESEAFRKIISGDGKIPNDQKYEDCFPEEQELGKKYAYYTINNNGEVIRKYELPKNSSEYHFDKLGRVLKEKEPVLTNASGIALNTSTTPFRIPSEKWFSSPFKKIESDVERCETKYGKGNCEVSGSTGLKRAFQKCSIQAKERNYADPDRWEPDALGMECRYNKGSISAPQEPIPAILNRITASVPIATRDGYALIQHPQSGKCLDGNGNSVYFGPCQEDNSYQKWRRNGNTMQHKASGKCLDVDPKNGSVQFSACPSWSYDEGLLRHEASEKCLDGDGNKVYTGPCGKDNVFQKWKPIFKSTFGNKDDLMQFLNYDASVPVSEIKSGFGDKDYYDNLGTDWARLGRIETYTTASLTKPLNEQKLSTYSIDDSSMVITDNFRNKGLRPSTISQQKKQSFMNFMPQE